MNKSLVFLLCSTPIFLFSSEKTDFKEEVKKDFEKTMVILKSSSISPAQKDETAQEFINKYGEKNFYYKDVSDYIMKRCIRNDLMGYCYYDGSLAINPSYDYAGPFYNGYAMVNMGEKWGGIDKKGNIIIEISYDKKEAKKLIEEFRKKNIKNPYVDTFETRYQKREITKDDYIAYNVGGLWGFIDKYDKELIPLKYQATMGFVEDMAWVKLNGKWGAINKKDKKIIDFKYDEVDLFYEDMARVKVKDKWGFVDKNGVEVIKPAYDYVNNFSEGFAMVESNKKFGFINKKGEFVIPLKYDYASSFFYGIAEVKSEDKVGYLDLWGNECCFKKR